MYNDFNFGNLRQNNYYEGLPDLKEGSTNDSVKLLQQQLKLAGLFPGMINGVFESFTTEAVKEFQSKNGLATNGIASQETWKKLFDVNYQKERQVSADTFPTLRLGDTGEYVEQLQEELKRIMYYEGPISGNFDKATQNSVKALQLNNKLVADGIVGKDTWGALAYLYSPLANCGETPEPPTSENTYTVKAGDTLYSIARMFNTTVDNIKRLNNLTSNLLSIGQKLIINEETPNYPEETIYTVKAGDSLYSISRKYNTTVDAIKQLNNLISNLLTIGQKLRIPKETTEQAKYVVKSGDTLYKIANNFNVTVDTIKGLNNLTSNLLSIGQILLIPMSSRLY